MREKILSLLLSGVLIASMLSGCGSADTSSAKETGDTVNIIVWEGSYPDELFENFEKETGIHVNCSYITNTDEILAKLIATEGESDYDFIDLESAYVKPFVDNNLLAEIDYSNIPNVKKLDEKCMGVVGDDDNTYTCPSGGYYYTLVVYNKETCPIEIKSFRDLADPALEGEICSVSSTITLFGMALTALGYQPDSTTESDYEAAADLWVEIKKNIKAFTPATYQSLENGECSVALCYDYGKLMSNLDNWDKYDVATLDSPIESYSSTWAIPSGAAHKKEAEMLMNYMLSDEGYLERVNYYPQMLSTEGVRAIAPKEIADSPAFNLREDVTDGAWMVPVSDEQIELMDKYLTKFMSN